MNYLIYSIRGPSFYIILAYWPYSCKNIDLSHPFGIGVDKNEIEPLLSDILIISLQVTAVSIWVSFP